MDGRQVASAAALDGCLDEGSTGAVSETRPPRSRSQIGKANSAKGKEAERRVASYLKVNGWPEAVRLVRTGYRNGENVSHDEGDIDKTPGIAWQVKYVAEKDWWQVPNWLADTESQRIAKGAMVGILVVRRPGHAHASEWWAHVYLRDVLLLLGVTAQFGLTPAAPSVAGLVTFPVRFELRHLIPLLHAAGLGVPA